ncbi:hypothetical protein GCM10011452_33920 [Gemmobacter lanyuensis]|uniref:Uncharacterized protein n=1 Tax=Gemmobacter lanyuensis TaxID=1054497 RepID=A0A918J1M9_9RHOB|nr:hypothetical protein GCM10011452_33920 [Gemmobacter lanyuensis]
MLEETEVSRGLVGKYVDTYAWPDGRFDVRWRGYSLPYKVFDPDQQHVTHAAIPRTSGCGKPWPSPRRYRIPASRWTR